MLSSFHCLRDRVTPASWTREWWAAEVEHAWYSEEAVVATLVSHVHAELYKYTAEQHTRQRALHCHVLGVEITDLSQTSPGWGFDLQSVLSPPGLVKPSPYFRNKCIEMSFTGQLLILIVYVCKCIQHSECTENTHQFQRI